MNDETVHQLCKQAVAQVMIIYSFVFNSLSVESFMNQKCDIENCLSFVSEKWKTIPLWVSRL